MISRILTRNYCKFIEEMADYKLFKQTIDKSQNILVLTGAGISAESGIPVFRGAGGLWRTHRCVDLASIDAFNSNPALVWEFYHWRRGIAFDAQPNQAHLALVDYENKCLEEGRKFTVVTQNVDNLHNKAGSKNVIELHGNLTKVICTKCRAIDIRLEHPVCEAFANKGDPKGSDDDFPLITREQLPKCKDCKGLVRPYIVWFGEHLDRKVLTACRELVENCDMCLVVGTSLAVHPAAMFAPLVAERGMPVAEFNILHDPASSAFRFYFSGKCAQTLPKALKGDD